MAFKMTENELLKRILFLKNQTIQLLADENKELKNKLTERNEGTDERSIIESSSTL